MTYLPLHSAYRNAIKVALLIQVLTSLFLVALLDGGVAARTGAVTLIAFWLGAAFIVVRRPQQPTSLDLAYLRLGFLPLLVLAMLTLPFLTQGHW